MSREGVGGTLICGPRGRGSWEEGGSCTARGGEMCSMEGNVAARVYLDSRYSCPLTQQPSS